MKLQEIHDFLDKAKRGKYMTVGQFMRSLSSQHYKELLDSAKDGQNLEEIVRTWAAENAPDITLVDDSYDGDGHGTYWITGDDNEDK